MVVFLPFSGWKHLFLWPLRKFPVSLADIQAQFERPLHKKFGLVCISCCFPLLQHICILLALGRLPMSCPRGGMGLQLRE